MEGDNDAPVDVDDMTEEPSISVDDGTDGASEAPPLSATQSFLAMVTSWQGEMGASAAAPAATPAVDQCCKPVLQPL